MSHPEPGSTEHHRDGVNTDIGPAQSTEPENSRQKSEYGPAKLQPGRSERTQAASQPDKSARSRVVAWALWDSGQTGLSAITSTFVFSVYLTTSVGEGTPLGATPVSWLARSAAAAGIIIALLAPL